MSAKGNSEVVFSGDEWGVRHILCRDAAMYYGSEGRKPDDGPFWCTANPNRSDWETTYNRSRGDLYIIKKHIKKRPHAQLFVSKAYGVELRAKFNGYLTVPALRNQVPELAPWLGEVVPEADTNEQPGPFYIADIRRHFPQSFNLNSARFGRAGWMVSEYRHVCDRQGEALEMDVRCQYGRMTHIHQLSELPPDDRRDWYNLYLVSGGGPKAFLYMSGRWEEFLAADVVPDEVLPSGALSGVSLRLYSGDPEQIQRIASYYCNLAEVRLNQRGRWSTRQNRESQEITMSQMY